jgi:hypothetical protein
MNPNFLNLFIKKLTRGRVVPMMSASVSWLIFAGIACGDQACRLRDHIRLEKMLRRCESDDVVPQGFDKLAYAVAGQRVIIDDIAPVDLRRGRRLSPVDDGLKSLTLP